MKSIQLALGLDACGKVLGFEMCGGDLISALPVDIISGCFDVSDACGINPPPSPSPGPAPPPAGSVLCDVGSACPSHTPVCSIDGFHCEPLDYPVACMTADVPSWESNACAGDYPVCARDAEGMYCTSETGLDVDCDEGGYCDDSGICNVGGCCPNDYPVYCMTAQSPRNAFSGERNCCSGDFPICKTDGCYNIGGERDSSLGSPAKSYRPTPNATRSSLARPNRKRDQKLTAPIHHDEPRRARPIFHYTGP